MYALGIPNKQYRRCTQVLGYESAEPINYDASKQDDGFWLFTFPDADEDNFSEIVKTLKTNGITTIGADTQLTEKHIMKLTDLLNEQGSPDENEMIDILRRTLDSWERPTYRGGIDNCERSDHYFEDVKDIIEDYEEESGMDSIAMGTDDAKDMEESHCTDEEIEEGTCGSRKKRTTLNERFQQLAGILPLYEQGFDDRLKAAGGFSDEEFDDITSTDPNPFMDDDDDRSPGAELASRTIEKLRQQYRGMSDQDMEDFSKEMVLHFLEGSTEAQAAAKVFFAKKGI